jgi:hypothetical protein
LRHLERLQLQELFLEEAGDFLFETFSFPTEGRALREALFPELKYGVFGA